MKLLFKLFFLLVLLSPFALMALFIASLQPQPLVEHQLLLTQKDISKAQSIFQQHDPRSLEQDTEKSLKLDKTAVDLAGRYLLHSIQPAALTSGFESELFNHGMKLKLSVGASMLPMDYFLNLQLKLSKTPERLQVNDLQLGQITIPDEITAMLADISLYLLSATEEWKLLQHSLVDYRFSEKSIELDYRWLSETEQLARNRIRHYLDNPSLQFYAEQLAALDQSTQQLLPDVMRRLFKLASSRSSSHEPTGENRAILLLLANWALGKRNFEGTRLPAFDLKINRRIDLAQHLLVSAAIASHSNRLLSSLIGTGKEIIDADGGSGFSVDDLTANRVGTQLGQMAVKNSNTASAIQKRLANIHSVKQIFPLIESRHAPLNQQQFIDFYGSVDDPRYEKLLKEIDLAINNTPLFKGL